MGKPDWVVGHIWVLGRNDLYGCSNRHILRHLHEIKARFKHRRLIHILHTDVHCGRVLKWAKVQKTHLQVRIGSFYLQSIAFLAFKTQGLKGNEKKNGQPETYISRVKKTDNSGDWLRTPKFIETVKKEKKVKKNRDMLSCSKALGDNIRLTTGKKERGCLGNSVLTYLTLLSLVWKVWGLVLAHPNFNMESFVSWKPFCCRWTIWPWWPCVQRHFSLGKMLGN